MFIRVGFLRGQAAIALSLAIPMMTGAVCIAVDMRAVYSTSVHLQQAANAAVLSGAVYLPAAPALAESAVRSKAEMNGIRRDEIVYDRSAADRRSITIVVERKAPYRFARTFGHQQSLVIVKAVAEVGCDARYATYARIALVTDKISRRNEGPSMQRQYFGLKCKIDI
jgi:hypothetical protein